MRWLALVLLIGCGGKEDPKPKTLADYCPEACSKVAPTEPGAPCVWFTDTQCRVEADPSVSVQACADVTIPSGDVLCANDAKNLCYLKYQSCN